MIQLANDPNASRMGLLPAQSDGKDRNFGYPRSCGGHAWPFLSRHSGRPAPQNGCKNPGSGSGS